ncbi:MAG: hypothetical protein IIA45_15955, partial [Bacteroidetes bacterium]|nr:hypothetical protein [Bacteroidota bacterium]
GTDVSDLSGKASVAALYAGSSFIILQGGYALGLDSGSLLRRIDDTLTVRVFKMNGLNRCIAKIERGDLSTVSVGDLFEIINWVSPKGSSLKVYLPSSDLDATAITQIVSQFNQLMQDDRFAWVRDPSEETPEYIIFYDKENWVISTPDGQLLLINGDVTAEYLRNNVQGGAKIFAYLPPSKSFYNELISKISKSNSVELTDDPNLARYHLVGTAEDGQARYAFYWPKVSREDDLYLSTMPLRTDFVNVNNENSAVATNTLLDYAEKIAKIKVWLNMHNPIDEGRFPFHLVLKNHKTEAYYHLGDTVYGDDLLVLALETDKENLESWDQKSRYIYVISIYNDGSIKVRFPESSENVGNKLPIMQNGEVEDITILSKKKGLRVGEPYGIDTYVMLTTDEPITFFEMMNSDAVYQNTKGEANYQELMYILNGNTKTRSVFTPANWSVYHLQVKTMGD